MCEDAKAANPSKFKSHKGQKSAVMFGYLFKIPFFVWIVLVLFILSWLQPYDNTDDVENGKRSGMVLKTDYGTGCQYLKAGFLRGLTPRLDGNGHHVGCR